MKTIRTGFRLLVIAAVLWVGLGHAIGWSRTSIETYCPFGGVEAALALVTQQRFTCATGERNLALFLALVGLTLVARKSFCSWVCPVGTVSEWCASLGRKLFGSRRRSDEGELLHALEPARRWDRTLRWLRLPVLAVVLTFTYKTGELVFRGYDPYYILFSFHGHDVRLWSYAVLALIVAGIVVIPMAWCRYLCPLGACLWPFSRLGRLRLVRNESTCTGCGSCDRACPHAIDISEASEVRSGECTLCFECTEACPEHQVLALRLR
jgi:polyferredoxin